MAGSTPLAAVTIASVAVATVAVPAITTPPATATVAVAVPVSAPVTPVTPVTAITTTIAPTAAITTAAAATTVPTTVTAFSGQRDINAQAGATDLRAVHQQCLPQIVGLLKLDKGIALELARVTVRAHPRGLDLQVLKDLVKVGLNGLLRQAAHKRRVRGI